MLRILLPPALLLWGLVWFTSRSSHQRNHTAPRAVSGVLDLSQWDFSVDGAISLDGEWLFFWNQFLTESVASRDWAELQNEAVGIKIPGFFADARSAQGEPLPMQGYGTFLLRVKGSAKQILPSLSRTRLHASSRILVFNVADPVATRNVINQGQPGVDSEHSIPYIQTLPPTHLTIRNTEDFYVLIQMSNFHFSKGGISPAPVLNEMHQEIEEALQERTLSTIISGIILALAFYNLTFFMRNRRDKASLYLCIFCVIVVWRSLCPLFFDGPGQFNLDVQYKTFYSSMVLPLIFITGFLRETFASHLSLRAFLTLTLVCLLYGAFVFLTPTGVFSRTAFLGQIILLSGCAMVVITAARAAWSRELGGVFSLIGCFCLVGATTLDVLIARGILPGSIVNTQYGLAIFLFMQSQIVGIRFASAFRTAEHLSRQLRDEVDRQTRDIKSILSSIRQGIFSLRASNSKSDDQTSAYLEQLLARSDVTDRTIDELLLDSSNLTADEKNQVREAIRACLGEDVLSFGLNEGNLVKEISLTIPQAALDRILEVDWAPILDKSQKIEKLLVSIRDVTDIRGFQREAQQKDRDLRMLLEVLNVPEDRFQRFTKQARSFIEENRTLLLDASAMGHELLKRLFVNMHTLKGGARSYQLKSLADASHMVEQTYVELRQDLSRWNKESLLFEIDQLEFILQTYLKLAEEKLGWDLEQRDIRMSKRVVERAINQLELIQTGHLDHTEQDALNTTRSLLVTHCSVRLSHIVDELKPGLDSMARDLGKHMPSILIDEGEVWLMEKAGDVLHSCLLHLFRNAMDHGLEKPDERLLAGKDPTGHIKFRVSCEADGLVIYFADDGRGMNLKRILEKGVERGLISEDTQDPRIIADLIVQPGFSTKDEVSEISGRGVGMDAVRTFLQDQGGWLFIELLDVKDPEHVAFTLKMVLPRALYVDMSLAKVV
ncbi:MAG TPA: 7TM diverse intracellular signaling domain-containing protein [Oligoflexus sp.]|uniref:7TM diverse intracellular signaling domain-containing protein n=1 Tax=Oligoflexus sp. TaxID=1971216 RepID=UPI002D8067B0|nr:7TM diverse intracellular signaling domain-containing protein [Oligoflexus sp.]HET9238151.1 7TM diverse intracellular signaling domain-containing protein [Oligoflexus sp.]